MAAPPYRANIFVSPKKDMPPACAAGFRELEREIPEYVANYAALHPSGSGGIYPPVPVPANNTDNYYWDPVTGFYWHAYGHPSTHRWKLATNNVHTNLGVGTNKPLPSTAVLFQWDTTLYDWADCWDMVDPYTYICPVNGYYRITWKIDVTLDPGQQVVSWVQTRTGTGSWSHYIQSNTANNNGTGGNFYSIGATGTFQTPSITPPSATPYTVASPYVELQWWWSGNATTNTLFGQHSDTYCTIDLIGTIDPDS